ncbi:hypothetical protein PVAP13_3KG024088 [Panicum virgatum]|uniref:Uncharacterized protein n=1 Tax=Panicum virgatum TaxID=38727 RepID=A0A8T0UPN3_PANVG|nr:hypothetical protein PVAP13_3KG024088 [Panicum virgatum]
MPMSCPSHVVLCFSQWMTEPSIPIFSAAPSWLIDIYSFQVPRMV